jgi:uncharacterized membrane protein
MKTQKMIQVMMATALTVGVTTVSTPALAKYKAPGLEKCYGIAKKMKNECGTSKHACAGQAKTNNDPNDWIMVLKGNCDMITGGSLTPPGGAEPVKK